MEPEIMTGAPARAENQVTLDNWRQAPFSRWAFHHVREIIPTAEIASGAPAALTSDLHDVLQFSFTDPDGQERTVGQFLNESHTTGLVVLRGGRIASEWYGNGYDGRLPHILFSVSKSITSLLTGILADEGLLAPDDPVTRHVPEVGSSAYADCTIRHLLDMTVSTSFDEVYLDPDGEFARYRIATGWTPPAKNQPPGDLRSFLQTLKPGAESHGTRFHYLSPNTDLLGWVLERASGRRFPDLMTTRLWQPMGAEAAAAVTVDPLGAPRVAGGICVHLRDLARIGELTRQRGVANGRQVVPQWWIDDFTGREDNGVRLDEELLRLFPAGRYRSKWYQTAEPSGAYCAIGIHGQWVYVDPSTEVVITRVAAQSEPIDDPIDRVLLKAFDAISRGLASSAQ